MTQNEFTELTNLPVEQYEEANATYMAVPNMSKQEWAAGYIKIKDSGLYKETVNEALRYEKYSRTLEEKVKELEAQKEEKDNKIYELAEFIAEQAEEKHSRSLAIKARELMGDTEYLIWKLKRDYYLSALDKKKIAALVLFAVDIKEELEESNDGVEEGNTEEA